MKTYTLIASLFVAVILLVTAFVKLFYPTQFLEWLQYTVAVGEVVLAAILVFFHRKLFGWVLGLLLFAGWAGYSLFWLLKGLPCGCLGRLYEPPQGLSLGADALFYLLACISIGLIQKKKKTLPIVIVISLVCLGIGYFFAQQVHAELNLQVRSQDQEISLLQAKKLSPSEKQAQ